MPYSSTALTVVSFIVICLVTAVDRKHQCARKQLIGLTIGDLYPKADTFCNTNNTGFETLIGRVIPTPLRYFSGNYTRRSSPSVGLPDWYVGQVLLPLDNISDAFVAISMPKATAKDWQCAYEVKLNEFCHAVGNLVKLDFLVSVLSFIYGQSLSDPENLQNYLFYWLDGVANQDSHYWVRFAKVPKPIFSARDRILLFCYAPFLVLMLTLDLLTLKRLLAENHSRTFVIHIALMLSDLVVYLSTLSGLYPIISLILGTQGCRLFGQQLSIVLSFYLSAKLIELSLTLKNVWLAMLAYDRWSAVWRPLKYDKHYVKLRSCVLKLLLAALFSTAIGLGCIGNWNFLGVNFAYTVFLATRLLYFVFIGTLLCLEMGLSLGVVVKLLQVHRMNLRRVRNGTRSSADKNSQLTPCLLLIGTTLYNSLLTSPHILTNAVDFTAESTGFGRYNFYMVWNMQLLPALTRMMMVLVACVFHSACITGFFIHCACVSSYRHSLLTVLGIKTSLPQTHQSSIAWPSTRSSAAAQQLQMFDANRNRAGAALLVQRRLTLGYSMEPVIPNQQHLAATSAAVVDYEAFNSQQRGNMNSSSSKTLLLKNTAATNKASDFNSSGTGWYRSRGSWSQQQRGQVIVQVQPCPNLPTMSKRRRSTIMIDRPLQSSKGKRVKWGQQHQSSDGAGIDEIAESVEAVIEQNNSEIVAQSASTAVPYRNAALKRRSTLVQIELEVITDVDA